MIILESQKEELIWGTNKNQTTRWVTSSESYAKDTERNATRVQIAQKERS